jgi:hypothetical protein
MRKTTLGAAVCPILALQHHPKFVTASGINLAKAKKIFVTVKVASDIRPASA